MMKSTPTQRAILDYMNRGAELKRTFGTLTGGHYVLTYSPSANDVVRRSTVEAMVKHGWITAGKSERIGIALYLTLYTLTDAGRSAAQKRGALAGAPAVEAGSIVREGR